MIWRPIARALTSPTRASTSQPCTCCWGRSSTAIRSSFFRMRGIERDELLGPDLRKSAEASALMAPTLAPEPLPADPDAFWGQPERDDNYDDIIGPARVPEEPAAVPRQLGRFPFWQGSEEFLPALETIYARASQGWIGAVPRRSTIRTIIRRRSG